MVSAIKIDIEYSMNQLPFVVPYIRWADVAHIRAGMCGPQQRRLYDHEIVLCVGGNGHIVIEGQSHHAIPNRLFLVQPRQWHSYRADSGEDSVWTEMFCMEVTLVQ